MVLVMLTAVVYFGCEKKTDQSEEPTDNGDTEVITTDTTSGDDTIEKEPLEETKITIPDIRGPWTGKFDGKSTTLEITEQTDSSFFGKISINYKQTLNQNVKGNFSPTALKITMIDQLHSKFMGKYNGKFGENYNSFSGTFTKNRDGSQYTFNLKK
jgi:FlaG/FlaF family flagellin (archaellin)